MIAVWASKHPLRDEWVEAHVPGGQTIREIVGTAPVHAWVDGHEVPADLIERARIKDGVTVVVRPVPQGDDIGRAVLQVGVAIAAAAVSVYGIPALGISGGTFASAAAGIGVATAGSLLTNALIPPPQLPQLPDQGGRSQSFNRLEALTGQSNQVGAFQPIPRPYGTFRFFPPIPMTARPFTELQGSDQYLRMLLCLGYGPLEIGGVTVGAGHSAITESTSLSGTPIKIGDTDIADFEGVEFEIGTPDQMSLYTDQVVETNPAWTTDSDTSGIDSSASGQWITDGESAIRTTDTGATEISVDVAGALFSVNSKGRTKRATVEWKIEYREAGTSTWTVEANPWVVNSTRRETVRRGHRFKVPQGQYDVRLTRIRTFHTDFEATQNEMTWTALRTIRGGKRAFDVDGTVTMSLRIKSTDQLNGRLENLSVLATSVLPVWNGTSWSDQATNNPAWIYADIWTGSANRRPAAQSDLAADDLLTWANEADTAQREYNGIFDSGSTVLERAREVAAAGRAAWAINEDAKITVVRDVPQGTPKMVITPRNSFDFSYELAAVEMPHALRVRFVDSTTWENTERLVFDDGYDEATATVYETLEAPGVTSPDQAWRHGRYHLAQQRLRPERYTFQQDVQHLRYRRGDLLTLSHDVILVGLAWGRVKSVTTDVNGDVTAFVSDEFLPMADSGKSYAVKLQRADGTIVTAGVQTSVPGDTEVTLNSPVSDIAVDDHFTFGESGAEAIEVKATAIEPQGDFIARVTCVPAADGILDAESGTIPAFDPVLTKPVDPDKVELPTPEITRIVSDETVLLRDGDGSARIRMVVESTVQQYPGWDGSRQVRYRADQSEDWIVLSPSKSDAHSVLDVDEAVTYEVQVRSVRGSRTSPWTISQQHTVVGKSSPPRDVTGFAASAARDRIELSWTENPEPDISHYIIREGSSWAAGVRVVRTDATSHQTRQPSNGPWWVKAVDTEGNESVNAAQATISPTLPSVGNVRSQVVDNNVLLRWSTTLGTFDLRTHEVRKGDQADTAEVVGDSDKTFDVIFELAAGTYRYWIVPVDAAGNEGTPEGITVAVDAPPDFQLRNSFQTDWQGYSVTNLVPIASVPLPAKLSTRDYTALEFDGTDDQVQIGDVNDLTKSFTIEALIYPTGTGTIVAKDDGSNGWRFSVESDGVLRFAHRTFNTANTSSGSNVVTPGRWYHVSVVFDEDADTVTLKVDNDQVAQTTAQTNAIAGNNATLRIGADDVGNEFAGRIAEVRLWDDVRTSTELANWMDRTLDGNESNLLGYWRMQAGSGETLADKSGNGNDGTILGAAWYLVNVKALLPTSDLSRDELIGLGYNSRDDMIAAGYDYRAQPTPASAQFIEVYDAGTVIPSTKITVTVSGSPVVGAVSSQVTISTKENQGDAWTDFPAGQSDIFATQFRYVKVTVDYTPDDDKSLIEAQDIETILSTKIKNDAGKATVSANPTTVSFNVSFVDVESITVTPQGTSALTPVVDFNDAPNPTSFDVYLFDSAGNAATGDIRWSSRGF